LKEDAYYIKIPPEDFVEYGDVSKFREEFRYTAHVLSIAESNSNTNNILVTTQREC